MTDVKEEIKQCCRCKEIKPVSFFTKNNAAKSKLASHCKKCDSAASKRQKEKDPEKAKLNCRKYAATRRLDFKFRLQMLVNASKQRAVLKNREHSITVDDLLALWPTDGNCPVFGFPLQFNSGGFRETSPSVDRIDSTRGYTLDNIQILSWKANRIKSYATVEELEAVVSFMKQGE